MNNPHTFETIIAMIQAAPREKRRCHKFTIGRMEALALHRVQSPSGGPLIRDGFLMGYPIERTYQRQALRFGPELLQLPAPAQEAA